MPAASRQIDHFTVTTSDGVHLRGAAAGPVRAPCVLLLHGFPDGWWVWMDQIAALADAGMRAIAPDLRGHGQSDAPRGPDAYTLARLAADVLEIAAAQGVGGDGRFDLVGHDWGGIIAFAVAARHPARVRRLTIVNAPHLDVVRAVMRDDPAQLWRSAYVLLFQLTGIAEALLRRRRFALLLRMIRAVALPGTFTDAAIARRRAEWARPGRLTAMLNLYRALVRRRGPPLGAIAAPTQIIWGDRDGALGIALAQASLARCAQGRLLRLAQAAHWPQCDAPAAVNAALVAWHASAPA